MAGRTVLVTGGTGGFGKATALGLAHPSQGRFVQLLPKTTAFDVLDSPLGGTDHS